MSITAFTPTKDYADNTEFTEAQLDAFSDSLVEWLDDEILTKVPDKTGTETIEGDWTFSGAIIGGSSMAFKRTTKSEGYYKVLSTDCYIAKTGISFGGDTVELPNAATLTAGHIVIVKDEAGLAASRNIVVDGHSTQTINGSATSTISTNYGSLALYTNGTNWFSW